MIQWGINFISQLCRPVVGIAISGRNNVMKAIVEQDVNLVSHFCRLLGSSILCDANAVRGIFEWVVNENPMLSC